MLFILLAYQVSDTFALRFALLMIGIVQLLSIPVAKGILRGCSKAEQTGSDEPELAGLTIVGSQNAPSSLPS
jgi:hypothetical protein